MKSHASWGWVVALCLTVLGISSQAWTGLRAEKVDDAWLKQVAALPAEKQVEAVVKKLKDTTGRPLWIPGLSEKSPDTILGYPYAVNQDVAVMAANAKSILFGEFKKYKIRRIKGVELLRLNERFAEKLQVGFFGYCRFDGRLLDAGLNPIKYYANSAT